MESLFKRIEKMGVKVGTVYMNREFFNRKVISKMEEHKLDFIIAAKSNKRINDILEKHRKENGDTSTVFEYNFQGEKQTFNIVAIWDQEKGYSLFATNELVSKLPLILLCQFFGVDKSRSPELNGIGTFGQIHE